MNNTYLIKFYNLLIENILIKHSKLKALSLPKMLPSSKFDSRKAMNISKMKPSFEKELVSS